MGEKGALGDYSTLFAAGSWRLVGIWQRDIRFVYLLVPLKNKQTNKMLEMLGHHRRLSSRVLADDNRRLTADSNGIHP